jgi:hypothetical protein
MIADVAHFSTEIIARLGLSAQKWPDLNINWIGTVIGATLVGSFCLVGRLLYRRIIVRTPRFNGRWYFQLETVETAYNPYRGMVLFYEVMLHQNGTDVEGSGEKYFERSVNGLIPHTGKNRARISLRGKIDPGIFRHKIDIQYEETNRIRTSSASHTLYIRRWEINGRHAKGTFNSTVAGQSGRATWSTKKFTM